ncbi:DNA polymerase III subunit delta [Endozoicomonas numazuensis]|uniref:DNA polymerase III subunit delta n=1 Tax=Endozoicomonas numazuensis TaxID=1137799 RepID=A0A081NLE4_9GAMM|nr:DNA polymerase III subunit delta [Endozoicomonas numazuensis]KEQ19267.1 DNA polymerase III subunit delta [Endozoicomonas numazuensis]
MKIRPDQLGAQLKRQLSSVYIVSGDEPLQVSECCDQIRQQARKQGFTERHVYHVDNSFDWGDFLAAANSLSLFAEKQILEIRMPNGKPGDSGRKAFQEYLKHLSPDNLLLIITDRLDNASQKAKWFKALDQEGLFIPIWPIEHDKLPGWIARRLKSQGFEASQDALSLLCERIEGNLLAASQEIEKLKLLANDKKIEVETVREAVSDSARYDVFQLADASLNGDPKSVVRVLGGLKSEGIEPPIVLWALAREVRLLSHLSRLKSRNVPPDAAYDQAAKTHGMSPFILKKRRGLLEKCIGRHSESDFRQMLVHIGHIDKGIKGLEKLNSWDELLTLSLSLTGMPASLHI